MSEYIRQSIPAGRSPYPGYRTPPTGGYIPLEKRSVLGDFAIGASIVGTTVMLGHFAYDSIWGHFTKQETDLVRFKKIATENFKGKGLRKDMQALLKRPDSSQWLKQTGNVAENTTALLKKGGGHSKDFFKGLWGASGGKWFIFMTTAAALYGGVTSALDTHKKNKRIDAFQARNPHRPRPPSS
jgi:hypothetical protein